MEKEEIMAIPKYNEIYVVMCSPCTAKRCRLCRLCWMLQREHKKAVAVMATAF